MVRHWTQTMYCDTEGKTVLNPRTWLVTAGAAPLNSPLSPSPFTVSRRQWYPPRYSVGNVCIFTLTVSSQCVVYVAVPPPEIKTKITN